MEGKWSQGAREEESLGAAKKGSRRYSCLWNILDCNSAVDNLSWSGRKVLMIHSLDLWYPLEEPGRKLHLLLPQPFT